MAINFPNAPADLDTHTEEGSTWTWYATPGCWRADGGAGSTDDFVLKTGDTMTGRLYLNTTPYALEGAKWYVDPAGSANPADPYAGNPFDSLSSLAAFSTLR